MRIDQKTWDEMLEVADRFARENKHRPSVARYVMYLHRQEMKRWKRRRKKGPTDERNRDQEEADPKGS